MQHQRLIARHLTTPKNSSSPGKLFGKINEILIIYTSRTIC